MSHDATCVSFMQNPSKRLGEIITGVNNPRNERHDNITSLFPVLDSEMLNVNMVRSFSGVGEIQDTHLLETQQALVRRCGSQLPA